MIICLCRAVSDRTLVGLIKQGADSFTVLRELCGVGTGCGQCVRMVKDLVDNRTGLLRKETCDTKNLGLKKAKEIGHG